VESAPGQGAPFGIELPVTTPPATVREHRAEEAQVPIRGGAILAVDDEPVVAELLADLLAVDDHRVDMAENGLRALEKLGERTYDLILADFKMPELDGPGLFREVERRHPHLAPRFIFLTGGALSPGVRGTTGPDQPGQTLHPGRGAARGAAGLAGLHRKSILIAPPSSWHRCWGPAEGAW